MSYIIFGTISAAVGIGSLAVSLIVTIGNKKKTDKTDGEKDGAILEKLNNIKETTEEIKLKLEKKDEQYLELVKKFAELEGSVKSAHKRIDGLAKYHQPI